MPSDEDPAYPREYAAGTDRSDPMSDPENLTDTDSICPVRCRGRSQIAGVESVIANATERLPETIRLIAALCTGVRVCRGHARRANLSGSAYLCRKTMRPFVRS